MSPHESEALLQQETGGTVKIQPVHDPKEDLQRGWRYPLWRIVGQGSPEDIIVGLISINIPLAFVAFAWNAHRTQQATFWQELGKISAILLGTWLAALLNQFITVIALVVISVVYAAKRRQQLRQQFGIDGTFQKDLLSWMFCAPFALAQEMRTLAYNRVQDGVWSGPAVNDHECTPIPQQVV